MSITTCPRFSQLDDEIIQDFMECLQENVEQIETSLNLLLNNNEPELINRLFRDIHSLKGNCRMVFLDPLVETIHSLEEVVSDMRQGVRNFNPTFGEFISTIVQLTNDMILSFAKEGKIEGEPQVIMVQLIEKIRKSTPANEVTTIKEALEQLQGNRSDDVTQKPNKIESNTLSAHGFCDNSDLSFFKQLSMQLDEMNIYKSGRTQAILDLCLSTNKELNHIVNPEQLAAAVYLHDLGMSLIPSEILNKPSKLSSEEFQLIKSHVDMGCQLLKRIPGWEEASIMVSQHHEKYNGSGYPLGLSHDNIHPGAMILALADTFYAITNERADRSYKKSLFSAVTLINGESGTQFNPRFVEAFNESIRSYYIAPKAMN